MEFWPFMTLQSTTSLTVFILTYSNHSIGYEIPTTKSDRTTSFGIGSRPDIIQKCKPTDSQSEHHHQAATLPQQNSLNNLTAEWPSHSAPPEPAIEKYLTSETQVPMTAYLAQAHTTTQSMMPKVMGLSTHCDRGMMIRTTIWRSQPRSLGLDNMKLRVWVRLGVTSIARSRTVEHKPSARNDRLDSSIKQHWANYYQVQDSILPKMACPGTAIISYPRSSLTDVEHFTTQTESQQK